VPPADQRGSDQAPLVVKVIPAAKTDKETADEKAQREDESAANWWMVRLTGVIILMTIVQVFVNGLQTKRLKETIIKMDEIAKGQTTDMKASIAEATRAAQAMESFAESMATNAIATQQSAAAAMKAAEAANIQARHIPEGFELTRQAVDIARTSAALSERALVSVQRPFVLHKRIDVGPVVDTNDKWVGWAIAHLFENVGNTPANGVEICAWMQQSGPGEVHGSFENFADFSVGSGLTKGPRTECHSQTLIISAADAMRLLNNELTVYIHAEARYNDALTNTLRYTRCCHRVECRMRPHPDNTAEPFRFIGGPAEHNQST
jgi:hypothetical protein